MMRKTIHLQLLITIIFILFFSVNLKAQIEDIKVGTATRKMLVYAPSNIEKNRPLVISMHGLNQDIAYQKNQAKWELVADANNFVVVYPAGINNSWDLYGTSDTDFILTIIDEMYKRYGVDKDRVYLSGFSMGGMMTYHAANVIADKIAAFAPVSGYLMGGPNTNSKRPIPIIHTHGTADDVVTFSGVQTCLNAWISRNGCPSTAVVTKPYPANKPSSNGTKYYWGPGLDQVSIVLLRIEGAGHWHSINSSGINTTEEIWNFCKNYSLGFGIPKFVSATVTEDNPKQILLTLSESISDSINFSGFSVKVDSQEVSIDNIAMADSMHFAIVLTDSLLNSNEITLSYNNGNVFSTYEKALTNFNDTIVENLLKGASPRLIEASTNEGGDTLLLKFNMKMQLPAEVSKLSVIAKFDGDIDIPATQCAFAENDSTQLIFTLGEKVFADYDLLLSNEDDNIASLDGGLLKAFSGIEITNNSIGLPVHLESGEMDADGFTISLNFSKPMVVSSTQLKYFNVKVNGADASLKSCSASMSTIKLTLSDNVHFGDSLMVSYTPGDVKAADKGPLDSISSYLISSKVSEPTWNTVPGKVEAEDYALQSGTDTEQTGDTGGGLNVGWIETGDWLDYAIENNSTDSSFEMTFRVASINSGCKVDLYVDGNKTATVSLPNTGNWQSYQSVNSIVTIEPGKHYIKMVAKVGGFNINYFDIHEDKTGIDNVNTGSVKIFPNPANNKISIQSSDFSYNKVEIINMAGSAVQTYLTDGQEIQLPLNLENGVYFVKLSNNNRYLLEKIVVTNN